MPFVFVINMICAVIDESELDISISDRGIFWKIFQKHLSPIRYHAFPIVQ